MSKTISIMNAGSDGSISDYSFVQKDVGESFNSALARYMAELEIDTNELSELTGISYSSFHYYNKNKRRISLNHVAAICIALRLFPLQSELLFRCSRHQLNPANKRDLIIAKYIYGCAFNESFSLKNCNAELTTNHFRPLTFPKNNKTGKGGQR